jgi:hypothetical protein
MVTHTHKRNDWCPLCDWPPDPDPLADEMEELGWFEFEPGPEGPEPDPDDPGGAP